MTLEPLGRFEWERLLLRCDLPRTTKYVGLVLAVFTNRDGGNAHPGNRRLAALTGLKERALENNLKTLRELGLIERTEEGNGNRYYRRADCYRLTLPDDLDERVSFVPDPGLTLNPHRDAGSNDGPGMDAAAGTDADPFQNPHAGTQNPHPRTPEPAPGCAPSRKSTTDVFTMDEKRRSDADASGSRGARPTEETFNGFAAARRQTLIREGEELSSDDEEFVTSVIREDYVRHVLGDLDGAEQSTADGMLANGAHPKAIINKVLKDRGESERDYQDAQACLMLLPDDVQRRCLETADQHIAQHFPDASRRYRLIYAARLARRMTFEEM